MRSKILASIPLAALLAAVFFATGCGEQKNCPTCGTTQAGSVAVIDTIPVPGSSPTGLPLNSFDIGWVDSGTHRYYLSDRSHKAVDVFDTSSDTAVTTIGGGNPCAPNVTHPDCAGGAYAGFTGSICCTGRGATFNPLSCPCGLEVTPDGKTLFVANGDSSVAIFDVTKNPAVVIAIAQTGIAFDPTMIDACIRTGTGCGDFRADEMAFDAKDNLLAVSNGDPAVPFLTLINAAKLGTGCSGNSCVVGQMFFDGGAPGSPCPSPSVSGVVVPGVKCGHGPAATNGLGASVFNPNTGRLLVSTPQIGSNAADGEVTEVDPIANVVTHHFPLTGLGCQVAGLAVGPAPNVLVGCANHDGVTFPPSTFIMDGGTGKIVSTITQVGGVDEVWFNPGDNRYYLAARDMPTGPVLGVIDAKTNTWLENVATGSNAHSVAADSTFNRVYVPLQPAATCGANSSNGCIAVYAAE